MQVFVKSPSATLDYSIDWSAWLGSDAISLSTWFTPAGLVEESTGVVGKRATIWLSGGAVGKDYEVVNTIITQAGLVDSRSIRIEVRQR